MFRSFLQLIGIRTDFEEIFFYREFTALVGKDRRVINSLIIILFFTLVALGFAVGSVQNLSHKMQNPFTNWVDLGIRDQTISKKAKQIQANYNQEENRTQLNINDVRGWSMFNLEFFHSSFDPVVYKSDTLFFDAWGRTIDASDPLVANILNQENTLWKSEHLSFEDGLFLDNCEIVITENLASKLGFSDQFKNIGSVFIREENELFNAKVVAVIKELPKFCEFVTSTMFFNIKEAKRDGVKNCAKLIIKNDGTRTNYSFIANADPNLQLLKTKIMNYFGDIDSPDIRINEPIHFGRKIFDVCEVSFSPSDNPSVDSLNYFLSSLQNTDLKLANLVKFECQVDYCDGLDPRDYYYLAFNFNKLDDIRAFQKDILTNHDVEIDMSQVESKENFALVSKLTFSISLILLGFGVLAIILFVNSLLKSHLNKVKKHLGTFKAFGLSNAVLNNLYLKIVFSFLMLSVIFSFLFAVLVDRIEQYILGFDSQFNIFSPWILGAIVILIFTSLIISSRTIESILGDTPGNLIYGR